MSLEGSYDPNNVFAKILRGEIPCARILEDEAVLAIMDAFPQVQGHVLVIPKTATARNILDISPQALAATMPRLQVIARAMVDALRPDGLTVTQFNGAEAGQTVFHPHFHLLPRWCGRGLSRHASEAAAMEELLETAARIVACLPAADRG